MHGASPRARGRHDGLRFFRAAVLMAGHRRTTMVTLLLLPLGVSLFVAVVGPIYEWILVLALLAGFALHGLLV